MGGLIAGLDWTGTPLGPVETWPHSLRVVVDLMLASPQPVYMAWGPDHTVLYNDAYIHIIGTKHPNALGRPHAAVWSEIMDEYGPAIDAVMAGAPQSFEDRPMILTGRPGHPLGWFSFTLTPLRDDAGEIAGFYATGQETTEKVEAVRRLRDSEARFRHLVEKWAQAVWEADADGNLIADGIGRTDGAVPPPGTAPARNGAARNEAARNEAARNEAGSGARNWMDTVHPDDRAEVARRWREAVAKGQPLDVEHRMERAGGGWGWTNVRAVPLAEPDGTPRKWVGMHIDVTKRREAEQTLVQTNTLLETLIESIPDPVFVKDTGGRFLIVNDALCRMMGLGRGRVVGARDRDFFPADIASVLETVDRTVMRSGNPIVMEEELPNSGCGDNRVYLTCKAPLRDAAGTITGVVGIARDITERRRAEEATQSARGLAEEANRAKSRFLAAASHDLRQPMQSLLLFLEVLKPHVTPTGGEAMRHLGRGLDALRNLLDSLLDVSRLDSGVVAANPTVFPIADLIEEMDCAYTPIAATKALTFQAGPCAGTVRSDRTLLGRMLRNLVENALRYTESGGVTVSCRTAGDRLRITVRDTGIGISAQDQSRIWEEFHQLGNPERDRNRGLGLGLSIVQRLSSLLDHPVDVRSAPGEGSEFSIEVPMGPASEEERPDAGVPEAPGNGRLVLLVDDDPIVLLGLKAVFETWEYRVLAAGTVGQALGGLAAGGRPPALVIADYRLRDGFKGTDAIRRVRDAFGPDIPGILLTGEAGTDAKDEAAALGLSLVHKPVTPRQLEEAVRNLGMTGQR